MTEQEGGTDPWTQVLDFLSRIVTPAWSDLIALLPLALVGLLLLALLGLAMAWRRASTRNRSRVPRPVPAGAPPAGVHLPGPSRWPFVLPFGAMFLLFGLALPTRGPARELVSPFNLPLLGIGLVLTAIALLGWGWDATREWRQTALADRGTLDHGGLATDRHTVGTMVTAGGATAIPGRRVLPDEPPPGIHLPGPSPWPFLLPIGAMFVLLGLIFHPVLLVAGVLMSAIAAVGWARDANHELRQTESGHAPEPATRDPRRVLPRGLTTAYGAIAAMALVVMVAPSVMTTLTARPSATEPSAAPGDAPSSEVAIGAANIAFDKQELVVVADTPFTITFENREPAPHNVLIQDPADPATALFDGELITGPASVVYEVPALPAGAYPFICKVHPNMTGTVTAR